MVGENRIVAFGTGGEPAPAQDQPEKRDGEAELLNEGLADDSWIDPQEADPPRRLGGWLPLVIAGAVIAIWTILFVLMHRKELAGLSPKMGVELVSDWSGPVILICVAWLLAMRNSRREARRFGDAAYLLSEESARLETRLVTVNRELSLAREFIAAQSRDIESLGRLAVERLSQHAERLQELVRDNGNRVETLGTVSESALDNMEKLRSQLPVIASSAKDVTNNIGNAGRTAQAQLEEMVNGFNRLNEFGQACSQEVQNLRSSADAAIAGFVRQCEHMEEIGRTRFAQLEARSNDFSSQLESREEEALAAIRARAAALEEELEATRKILAGQEDERLAALRARAELLRGESAAIVNSLHEGEESALQSWKERLANFEDDRAKLFAQLRETEDQLLDSVEERLRLVSGDADRMTTSLAERHQEFSEKLERLRNDAGEAHARLLEELEEHGQRLSEIAAEGERAQARVVGAIEAISRGADETRAALAGAESDVDRLTDSSVRLLELLQASASNCREELPAAIAQSEARLAAIDHNIVEFREALEEAGRNGQALASLIDGSSTQLKDLGVDIVELQTALGERSAQHEHILASLRSGLSELEQKSNSLTETAQAELSVAVEKLSRAVSEAVENIDKTGSTAISALARQLGEESAEAIEKAIQASSAEASGQLEQAASHAAGVGRQAAIQLRDQLAKVNELVGNLEQRVAYARERAEEQVDNDFARRVALITESLNSYSIDIAKALSTEVSDTAWAAYLRGDRGIFTRRAVNLIGASETKAIQQIFERDNDFREHVNRFIHDFEAILRQVLSTRDGNVLGVTLLSSDMGKLYVAMAQAIERLRN